MPNPNQLVNLQKLLCGCLCAFFVPVQEQHLSATKTLINPVPNFTLTGTKTCWSIRALPATEALSTGEIQEYKQDGVVLEKLKKMHWIFWMNYSEASSPLGILTSYYLLQLQPVTLPVCTEFNVADILNLLFSYFLIFNFIISWQCPSDRFSWFFKWQTGFLSSLFYHLDQLGWFFSFSAVFC